MSEVIEAPQRLHAVIGLGPVGVAVAQAALRRGERVRLVSFSGERPEEFPADVEVARADVLRADDLRAALRGATHVYNCTNARDYHRWPEQFPPLQRAVLSAAREVGAVLVAVENLYVYGPHEGRDLHEDTPMNGRGPRSSTRVAMTRELDEAHRRGDLRVVRVRASDLLGPRVRVSLAGATLFEPILSGARWVSMMADPDLPHSLSFAPDSGRALVTAGIDPTAPGQVFHAPCSPAVSPRALVSMIAREAGVQTPRIAAVPRVALPVALPLLGVAVPAMQGISENVSMFYERFVVDDARYQRRYREAATPLDEAVRETVRWYRTAARAAGRAA